MEYSNDKIKRLVEERDKKISELDYEIEQEIQKERAKHKFSWKRFGLLLAITILPFVMVELNSKIFPKTSIWSWSYYIK